MPVVRIVDHTVLIDNCRVRPEHISECEFIEIIEIEEAEQGGRMCRRHPIQHGLVVKEFV